jgi:hypothetical protein
VIGRPSTPFVFFAATGLLPAPVTIPGWGGMLEINSPSVLLLTGTTDAGGSFSVPVNTPPGAAQIYVQGGQTGTVGPVDLGYAQLVNLY